MRVNAVHQVPDHPPIPSVLHAHDRRPGRDVSISKGVAGEGVVRARLDVSWRHDHVGKEELGGGRPATPEMTPRLPTAQLRTPVVGKRPLELTEAPNLVRRRDSGIGHEDFVRAKEGLEGRRRWPRVHEEPHSHR